MASDDLVWSIIGTDFCSYKLKTRKDQTFCRNEYNVTGLCTRQACPLANSRYATIRPDPATGTLYLYIKAIERSHLPNKWWEKIKLSGNYTKALEQVDQHLQYYPKFLVHKSKQRLTRLTQVAIRIKKLAKEEERLGERLVPRLAPKVRRREEGRERKALAAAKVERAIERVLIDRLRSGAYGDRPLNVEPEVWKRVLRGLEKEGEAVRDEDLDEGIEEENEYEQEEGVGDVEYVSDIEESDDELEDFEDWVGGESPDEEEDEDEDEGQDEDEEAEASASGEEEEGSSGEDDIAALKKKLDSLKRKRPTGPPPMPKKKPTKRDSKGPKREIEYEMEREPQARELLRS
ncbi:Mak16 protein [Westerdykella ornata]|uniref:Protein MAK16 n=1 Tax=Westerdykella ornata TaxID=318751 RepID=A0A6A6J4M6_WESOR|nr:Mak16 protein [Westerdykella ornata]KAF2271395.1 Mak16 protein [Westerdykella ornata]